MAVHTTTQSTDTSFKSTGQMNSENMVLLIMENKEGVSGAT